MLVLEAAALGDGFARQTVVLIKISGIQKFQADEILSKRGAKIFPELFLKGADGDAQLAADIPCKFDFGESQMNDFQSLLNSGRIMNSWSCGGEMLFKEMTSGDRSLDSFN